MAENFTRVQRYENGQIVEEYTVAKPTEQYNEETLLERAHAALSNNADFLALASPTNAQVLAEVRALARQNNAIIRLTLRQLDDISDTGEA